MAEKKTTDAPVLPEAPAPIKGDMFVYADGWLAPVGTDRPDTFVEISVAKYQGHTSGYFRFISSHYNQGQLIKEAPRNIRVHDDGSVVVDTDRHGLYMNIQGDRVTLALNTHANERQFVVEKGEFYTDPTLEREPAKQPMVTPATVKNDFNPANVAPTEEGEGKPEGE